MIVRAKGPLSETQKKRSLLQRMVVVHALLFVCLLVVIARLMELQIIDRSSYYAAAHAQHFGKVELPAQRGEILGLNSKSGETSILATNTTLDLLYVDPLITDDPAAIADLLATTLLTEEMHSVCSKGGDTCPRELLTMRDSPYAAAYDPLILVRRAASGAVLEPLPADLTTLPADVTIPPVIEARRRFALDIEQRISEKRVTFAPLKYSATKQQMQSVSSLSFAGVYVNEEQNLIYVNPEETQQSRIGPMSRSLSEILEVDPEDIEAALTSRPLRYVPIMRRLPPALSLRIKELKLQSLKDTNTRRSEAVTREAAEKILDPMRSIALIAEHWRYYPDGTIASHVVGFLNINQQAQYGIERTFDTQLRGQEGRIYTVSDPHGGQILTADQTIVDPEDGDTIVLTIDPFIQKEVERIMQEAIEEYGAESAQAIVMEPYSGKVIAMVNAPLFERNSYTTVYDKEPVIIGEDKRKSIVVEVFHPVTNARLVKAYIDDIFTEAGRAALSEKTRQEIAEVETLYDIKKLVRYYLYIGESTRHEVFPTSIPNVWLKFKNNLGVGAYLNRTVQEIYEPGSVMKPITMAIAIDQGEVVPSDTYMDTGVVEKDEFKIRNSGNNAYGHVNMTNCLEFSINTCMTDISDKLGKKLFHRMLQRFGFGNVTGIELEDELAGDLREWRRWADADLATASFGQGVSSTPLQMVSAISALANGGRLMRPYIIDHIVHSDGAVEHHEPFIVDQVITEKTSDTIKAMLVSAVDHGFASKGKVKGYKIAGKTGTSQIARPGGGYETGTGSTVASYVGFAPVEHPKFVTLVKFDHPRRASHGAELAAPVFQKIAAFLLEYYGVPPDEN